MMTRSSNALLASNNYFRLAQIYLFGALFLDTTSGHHLLVDGRPHRHRMSLMPQMSRGLIRRMQKPPRRVKRHAFGKAAQGFPVLKYPSGSSAYCVHRQSPVRAGQIQASSSEQHSRIGRAECPQLCPSPARMVG